MKIVTPANPYKNHRFPAEIINHAVWLSFRFCLSYRDVEELLFARGVTVTYEAIREWCRKFGQQYANQLRRRRPWSGDKWHLNEMFLTIHGARHYLWRAVDQDGNILRAENSHQPTRQREQRMQGFKSPSQAQRFLSAYGPIMQYFRPRRHLFFAPAYRQEMRQRLRAWQDITNLSTAA